MMKTPNSRAPQAILALTLLLAAPWALADAEDTFNLTPSVGQTHDDNLFRKSKDEGTSSEDITTSALRLKISKRYSLQRFQGDLAYVDNRYQSNSYLSYNARPYKAAWLWSLTPNFHGNLSTERATTLYNFADFSGSGRNLNTTENSRFDSVFDLNQAWQVLAGVSKTTYTNSQATEGDLDSTTRQGEAGIRYTFSSGSSLSYITRYARGNYYYTAYLNPLNPSEGSNQTAPFDRSENEMRLLWALTAKTSLDARLAYLSQKYEDLSSRDFGGTVGNINFNWAITEKTSLTAALARDLSGYTTATDNYIMTDRLSLIPLWQISEKTALRARYDYAQRDYLGSPFGESSGRNDTLQSGMIALEWQALRTATISTSLQTEKRDSNESGLDYSDNRVNVSAQITF